MASGYRSCPFTIIKQNNNQNTQNTDSISRIQWSCCVCVIMQLIGCMYFCALNLVSSYLRIMMANYKYAEDTSKKEKNSLCRADKKKKQVTIIVPFLCWSFITVFYSLYSLLPFPAGFTSLQTYVTNSWKFVEVFR